MTRALRRAGSSLAVPNSRRYFAGQTVSVSGNWMQTVAEMWLIVQLTGSGAAVGLTAGLQFVPILLFGAWGGLIADRLPKRLAQLIFLDAFVPANGECLYDLKPSLRSWTQDAWRTPIGTE